MDKESRTFFLPNADIFVVYLSASSEKMSIPNVLFLIKPISDVFTDTNNFTESSVSFLYNFFTGVFDQAPSNFSQ